MLERLNIVKKKKILFFIYQMGGGGAARTLLNIINNIDRTKFTPVLVTLNHDGSYEKSINDDVKFIKLDIKRLRSAILPLSKVIRKERADLVFSTIPNYNIIALLATMLSFSPAKNVVREAAYLGGSVKENIKLRFAGRLYRRASKVIALSRGVKKNIINRYKVNSDKIDIIYNPVDIEAIRDMMAKDELSDEHKVIFQNSGRTIITAGRLHPDKDQKTLLKAFEIVKENHDDSHLFILGEGQLEAELKQLADDLNIADSVHFAGFRYNPYAYFKHADLFVLSSVREGFGHVLTEAMATGTPVVSTKAHPGADEVLASGEFGHMCEPSDEKALAAGINHIFTLSDGERAGIIEKGLKRAEEFHVNKIIRQYEQMFTEVLDK
ncbi:Glycosyltransferase involved in cell wall bisynthesis [Lacicoccus qingdaonensis]|uniref:Glycosyltransferase involved in cell wall bisynthesis n=1 Tax=Lacicoccus qingdaonensis TaxID=576118 RepID=A0A1G9F7D5_9BACL|nr:Glycosyltransferase involved in cell wall bisynthesis [Salinicoccus qingdaonensis]